MGEHALTVQVDGQTVVEQGRSEVQTYRATVHVRGLQCTIVVQVAYADTIGHLEVAFSNIYPPRYACIDFLGPGGTIDFVLPIGIGSAQGCNGIGIVAIVLHEELLEGIGAQHVDLLGNSLERTRHVYVHLWL